MTATRTCCFFLCQGLAIVSSEDMMSVVALVKEYSLNAKVITKVNKLRATAGLPLLAAK